LGWAGGLGEKTSKQLCCLLVFRQAALLSAFFSRKLSTGYPQLGFVVLLL
jgi:hypothetical protein